jgi:hypothetical protein
MADPIYVEQNRLHSATGAFTASVSGASDASPIVITTSAANSFISGDEVQITGVTGNTAANGLWFINVLTSTTFQLFQDQGLSVASTGNGSYSSGGAVSEARDISLLTGNFELKLELKALTATKNATVCVQDSADGFVNDIVTRWEVATQGGSTGGFYLPPDGFTVTQVDVPDLRIGISNARVRVFVAALDSGGSVTVSLSLNQ